MAKVRDSHAQESDGIKVIFDQSSPSTSPTRSRSRGSEGSSHSSGSSHHRGRTSHRRRYRSSSSTSSSRSRSQSRSRSHPRCRRHSRCRCNSRRGYGHGRYHNSPSHHYRSRSRSSSRQSRHRRYRSPQSSSISHKGRSSSRSSGHSGSLHLDDKRELLKASKDNAMMIPGTGQLEHSRSMEPILSEQPESKWESQTSGRWVRHDPEKTSSQSDDSESEDMPAPKISLKRNIISFSLNNSVAKPVVATPSFAKVTARVDIYESRKPYGHWIPVKSGRTRKHTHASLH